MFSFIKTLSVSLWNFLCFYFSLSLYLMCKFGADVFTCEDLCCKILSFDATNLILYKIAFQFSIYISIGESC